MNLLLPMSEEAGWASKGGVASLGFIYFAQIGSLKERGRWEAVSVSSGRLACCLHYT